MVSILESKASSWRYLTALRPAEENPLYPQCKRHLQRICGVCKFYQGDPIGGATGQTRGQCARFNLHARTLAQAGDCPAWERRDAE